MSVSGSINIPKGDPEVKNGINMWTAGIFLVAEMAGAGFLALPSAIASTGWIGIPMMFIFCFSLAYAGERLGQCWIILEERWPEYKKSTRQPYMEIAQRSYGEVGRKIILFSVLVTLIGTSIVYIILIAQFLNAFFEDFSICFFTTVISLALIPFTWLGTPKDFWQAPIIAMVSTVVACLVIFVQLLLDRGTSYITEEPFYQHATFTTFSMGFGTIMAAFGGGPVFPTIQNDMKEKTQFSKSVIMAFIALLIMYFPVTFTGYLLMGYDVPSNILLYRESDLTLSIKIAVGFEVINLFGSFLILVNPVFQVFEEIFNIPSTFGIKRVLLRTSLVLFDLVIALGIPDFSLILNLIGGSTMTICSLIAPAAMYMKLVDDKSNPDWRERSIPTWLRILLYELIFVGILGGICSTGSAIYAIIKSNFGSSCFADFSQT